MPQFFFLIFVAVVVITIVGRVKQARRTDESWHVVGNKFGLRTSLGGAFGHPSMTGRHLGFPVKVWSFVQTAGNTKASYTRFEIRYPSLRLGLQLEHQGLVSKLARMVGGQDLLIGNRLFDDNVVIKGRNVRDLREFLTPERRVRILRALENFPGTIIMDARVVYTARGVIADASRLERTIARLCELAKALTTDPAADSTFGRGLEAQWEGRLDDALDLVHQAATTGSGDVDARVVKGQILLSAGRYPEAVKVLDEIETEHPDDEQVAGLAREARRLMATPPVIRRPPSVVKPREIVPPPPEIVPAPPSPEPPPLPVLDEAPAMDELLAAATPIEDAVPDEPAPVPDDPEPDAEEAVEEPGSEAPPPAPAGAVDLVEICEALFGADVTSFDGNRIFEETYAGRSVSWTGELRRVDTFYRDSVFGDGPGARANLLIYEVGRGAYSGREVQAVVQLPAGADADLRPRRGESIAFEGELVRCDTFMRNLFVADGWIVETG